MNTVIILMISTCTTCRNGKCTDEQCRYAHTLPLITKIAAYFPYIAFVILYFAIELWDEKCIASFQIQYNLLFLTSNVAPDLLICFYKSNDIFTSTLVGCFFYSTVHSHCILIHVLSLPKAKSCHQVIGVRH